MPGTIAGFDYFSKQMLCKMILQQDADQAAMATASGLRAPVLRAGLLAVPTSISPEIWPPSSITSLP